MIKNPDKIYFWWSSSYVHCVDFVRWQVMRMHTGGKNTNQLGVGVVVESDWLFNAVLSPEIPRGCKRGQHILAPYHDLYRTYNDAYRHVGKIRRPTVEEVRALTKNEKELDYNI